MNMQVENMPEDLRERLRRPASKRGSAVSEVVISLIEKELDHDGWVENLHERPGTALERSDVSERRGWIGSLRDRRFRIRTC